MDSDDEKYDLNWSKHANHIKNAFDKILQTNDFVDVTLSCEGKKIKAHRVILSACSDYFYDILKDNPCQHPTIVLKDVKYNNIKYLLKYMYCGKVQVSTEDFGTFLETAEMLQVAGLRENENNGNTSDIDTIENKENDVIPSEKTNLSPSASNKRRTSIDRNIPNKRKKEDKMGETSDFSSEDENNPNSVSPDIANVQRLLNDGSILNKDTNPDCECPVCAEKFPNTYLLRQHIAFHLGETTCEICSRKFTRLDLLKKHMAAVHKINLTK